MTELDRRNPFIGSDTDHGFKQPDQESFDRFNTSIRQPSAPRVKRPKSKTKTKPTRSNTATISVAAVDFLGSSREICSVRELIKLYGPEEETILVTGETGTGKEAVAQLLHLESPAKGPFLSHNAGRVDHHLTGSEFFGHKKGAFTGAIEDRNGLFVDAHGGTLHLDEIGEMPFELQANLLRTIEDGIVTPVGASCHKQVNVRVIAATNKDLLAETNEKRFRSDLYHRLNVLRIDVPPLRARGDDVIEIADFFLEKRFQKTGIKKRLNPAAAKKLSGYSWPGNVRELKNVILRASINARENVITEDAIFLDDQYTKSTIDVETARELVSRYVIATALKESGGNASEAARRVNLSRQAIHTTKKKIDADGETHDLLAARIRDAFGLC